MIGSDLDILKNPSGCWMEAGVGQRVERRVKSGTGSLVWILAELGTGWRLWR